MMRVLLLIFLLQLLTATRGEFFRFQMPEEVPVNTEIADLPSLLNLHLTEESAAPNFIFKILSSNPVINQMFAVDQRTGMLRTSGPIDRDQLCQRAELCCTMVGQHEVADPHDVKIIGMETVQSKFGNHIVSTGLKCLLNFRVAYSSNTKPTSFATIQIDLLDLNDNAPKFMGIPSSQISRNYDGSLVYVVSVSENAHIGYQLPLPVAQDGDAGTFGIQGYKLESPSAQYLSHFNHRFSADFPFELVSTRRDDGVILPKLELREQLDFERRQDYYISLIAYDSDRHMAHSSGILVRVDVIDENDNQPNVTVRKRMQGVFDSSSAMGLGHNQLNLREDTPVGTLLATFEARDADSGENGRVTFAWAETIPPRVQRLFELNPTTGELRLADRLDYDGLAKSSPNRAYNLVVVASDDGRPNRLSTSASITIELIDVNDEEPKITIMDFTNRSPTQLEVLENAKSDTFVALVTVEDLDGAEGPNGQFYCMLNSTLFRLIYADAFMGHKMIPDHDDLSFIGGQNSIGGVGRAEFQLVTTTSFDREQTPVHFVSIRCRDKGISPLESQTTFAVTVLDVNDNPPQFPANPLTVTIPEDAQPGSLVVNLNATDPDRPDDPNPLTYSLVSVTALSPSQPMNPVNSTHFRLEGHSGRLLLTEPLDREMTAEYQLTVRATDRGSPSPLSCDLALRIQVLDVNDNTPVFGNPSGYRFVIEEEKEPGTVVGVVSATDADEGKNGKVSYRLFGTAAAVQRGFAVNPNTGEITTKMTLDREVNAVFEFLVTAEDSSSSKRLTATVKVVVELLDVNDNDPKFIYPTQPNHTIHASAYNKVGSPIVKLTVFDADAAGEQGLLFLLKNSTSQGLFSLSPSTGELSFAREILDDDIGSHYLEIEAKDNGVPPRSSVTSITVIIDTRNPQRSAGSVNLSADYVNNPTHPKSWNQREEAVYSHYGMEANVGTFPREDLTPSFDRRIILICCLAFLGFLLLVLFGAILIKFRYRASPDTANVTNTVNFVHPKEAKYRAATLQPQTNLTGKDVNRYIYGWSAQRSPLVGGPRSGNIHQQQHQRLLQEQQQEQFLQLGYVNGTNTRSSSGTANFDSLLQIRPTRDEATLLTKNRSNSMGDSLEDYERPPMPNSERSNLYPSHGQVNRGAGAWDPRNDRGLNNYDASGYYNKLSANGGGGGAGIILQPGDYMQVGQYYQDDCMSMDADAAADAETSVFLSGVRSGGNRNAYQTLSNVTSESSSNESHAKSTENTTTRCNEADPFADGPEPASSDFEHVNGSTTTKTSISETGWRKNLGKKGIVSSSFV